MTQLRREEYFWKGDKERSSELLKVMINVWVIFLRSPGASATSVTHPLEPVVLADTPISLRGQFLAGEEQVMNNIYPGNITGAEEAEGGNTLTVQKR